jgi:hypothetical protein
MDERKEPAPFRFSTRQMLLAFILAAVGAAVFSVLWRGVDATYQEWRYNRIYQLKSTLLNDGAEPWSAVLTPQERIDYQAEIDRLEAEERGE